MSKANNTFLHLPMDEIRNGVAVNVGVMGGDATVKGKPQIIHDPELGSCMLFDGIQDYLDIQGLEGLDLKEGMTIAVWVRFDALQSFSRILDINNKKNSNDNIIYFTNTAASNTLEFTIQGQRFRTNNVIKVNAWQHFAITVSPNGSTKLLVDGQKLKEEIKTFFPNMKTGWTMFSIGKSSWDHDKLFKGAMADFRLYDYPLEEKEVADLMKQDKSNMAVYRETAPLKMELYSIRDDNHLPVIFIESDNKSEPLELSITNPTDKPIILKGIENATVNDFHFQLRFRKNVVAPNVLDSLRKATDKTLGDWKYSLIGAAEGGKEDWISFVRNGGADFSLLKGESTTIQMPTFSASAQGGARNTRVEVRYQIKDIASGSIIRHLEIHSHLGLKTVPLIAQVKGSGTILNNGTSANELTIEVLFTKQDGSVMLSADRSKPARFELIVAEDLMVSDSLSAATTTDGFNAQPSGDGQGHKVFTFEVQKAISLGKGNKFVINISNWVTNAEAGIHNLLLRYENIPGYWDGAWVLPVEMGPIVIQKNNVGIGTDDPKETLHLEGNMLMNGQLLIGDKDKVESAKLLFQKEYPENHNEPGIIFAPDHGDNDSAWIRFHSLSGAAHNLEIQVNQVGEDYLVLNPKGGNVGIGTDNPQATLHVNGRIKDQTGFIMPVGSIIAYGGSTAPEGWLLCDGLSIPIESKYSDLKAIIGAATPDLRSRFIVGAGQGNGLKNYNRFSNGGEENHRLTLNEMPEHNHSINFVNNVAPELYNTPIVTGHADWGWKNLVSDVNVYSKNSDNNGGNQPHNNIPPYYALTYIIKY